MVWPFGSGDRGSNEDRRAKVYAELDDSLREYLDQQTPASYGSGNPNAAGSSVDAAGRNHHPSADQGRTGSQPATASKHGSSLPDSAESPSEAHPSGVVVPEQSLFPDGRYAHLWAGFESSQAALASGRSQQERIREDLRGFKQRRTSIKKAAAENCMDAQAALSDCFRNGTISERFTVCRQKMMAYERCYNVNTRLLKALGYLSADASAGVEGEQNGSVSTRRLSHADKIQMHADTLYTEMLAYEAKASEARKQGIDLPPFRPNLASMDGDADSSLKPPHATPTASEAVLGTSDAAQQPLENIATDQTSSQSSSRPPKDLDGIEKNAISDTETNDYLRELAYAAEVRAAKEVQETIDQRRRAQKQQELADRNGQAQSQNGQAKPLPPRSGSWFYW